MADKDDGYISATVTSVLPDPLFTDRQIALLVAVWAYGQTRPLSKTIIRYAEEVLEFLQPEDGRESPDAQA